MLDVTDRAGPARRGKWTTGQTKVEFPNILFRDSSPYPAPPYAELTVSGTERIELRSRAGDELASYQPGMMRPLDTHKEADVEPGSNAIVVRGKPSAPLADLKGEVVVLGNAFELRRDARAFADAVVALREAAGPDRLLYAPGLMPPPWTGPSPCRAWGGWTTP